MAENEVQTDLKKRARRRLVGAIALALLAAVVLPMVMDPEPKPGSNELSIRIPSQEGSNFASRLITGAALPPTSPELPLLSSSSAPVPVKSPEPVAVQSKPASMDSKPAVAQSSVETKPAAPVVKPVAPVEPVSKPPSEELRARQILEGKPAQENKPVLESKPAAPAGKFFVQLGVYREEANAREVLARATAGGVKASSEKLDGKTRVRVGPFAERSAADAVVAKLKSAGLSGIVTSK